MDKFQALHSFWNSFGIPAYDTTTVPDEATQPYLTYEMSTDSFGNEVAITNNLYYYSRSWLNISLKVQEISEAIGMSGKLVKYDGGAVWVKRANPFSQRIADDDDNIKRVMLNFSLEFISND